MRAVVEALVLAETRLTLEERVIAPLPDEAVTSVSEAVVVDEEVEEIVEEVAEEKEAPAEEVVEEFASFPSGDHDDLVDSSTQALLRFRQGGFIPLSSDEEEKRFRPRRADYY